MTDKLDPAVLAELIATRNAPPTEDWLSASNARTELRTYLESNAPAILSAIRENEALRKDAERWNRLVELWHCGELALVQNENGGWTIALIEPVDDVTFQPLTGDTPDAAIDAAITQEGKG